MRKRFQKGSLKKVNGAWIAQWWENHHRRSRTLGRVGYMTKAEAFCDLAAILEPINNRARMSMDNERQNFGDFVEHVYLPCYERTWKGSTIETNRDRIRCPHLSVWCSRAQRV